MASGLWLSSAGVPQRRRPQQPGQGALTTSHLCPTRQKIAAALDPVQIQVDGAYDDPNGSHITIFCVSEKFEGKRSLARQQMVFKAIWDEMQGMQAHLTARQRRMAKIFASHGTNYPVHTGLNYTLFVLEPSRAPVSGPVHAVDRMVLKSPSEMD
jgi:stress-induced morphogen